MSVELCERGTRNIEIKKTGLIDDQNCAAPYMFAEMKLYGWNTSKSITWRRRRRRLRVGASLKTRQHEWTEFMYISGYIEKVKRKVRNPDCSDTRVGKRKSWTPRNCRNTSVRMKFWNIILLSLSYWYTRATTSISFLLPDPDSWNNRHYKMCTAVCLRPWCKFI
jgi:hypothetical protein